MFRGQGFQVVCDTLSATEKKKIILNWRFVAFASSDQLDSPQIG